jgi:uncharacterized membrane protein YgdD (TMEM256/DUF423 family)
MIRLWLAIAGLGGLASVAAGALAAHLAGEPKAAELLRTGATYGMVHAAALIAVGAGARAAAWRRGGRRMELCRRYRVVQRQPVRAGGE